MAEHNRTGRKGETLAIAYFKGKDYQILHHNWRYRNWEVDIIAYKNGILHFIEVKTRTSTKYGYPEDDVTTNKIMYLTSAAEEYLYLYPQWQRIQFDILSIIIDSGKIDYFLIEDVYL
jgi:putative endonuclease